MGFATNLRNGLSALFSGLAFTMANALEKDETSVIYAGPDKPSPDQKSNEFEFGIYDVFNGEAMWLPAVTAEPVVINQLKAMKPGQSFKITAEANDGGIGTRVNAIEVGKDALVFKIPAGTPSEFKI